MQTSAIYFVTLAWSYEILWNAHAFADMLTIVLQQACFGTNLPIWNISLTLSQWSSSGNPVAIQCTWNLNPSVHWNATGERIVGSQCVSSVLPVVFQWLSSGLPVCSSMQINTGSPLGYHWVLASASVGPVASQCACGSSGLPVCSNYAN